MGLPPGDHPAVCAQPGGETALGQRLEWDQQTSRAPPGERSLQGHRGPAVRERTGRHSFPRRPVGTLHGQVAALLAPDLSGVAVACPDPGGWVVRGPSPDPSRPTIDPMDDQPDDQAGDPAGTRFLVAGLGNRLLRIPQEHLDSVGTLTDGLVHDAGRADPDLVRSLLRLGVLEVVAEPTAWGLTPAAPEG